MHIFQTKQVSAEASVQFVKVSPKLYRFVGKSWGGVCVGLNQMSLRPCFFGTKCRMGSLSFLLNLSVQLSVFVSLGKCNQAKWDGPKMWGTAFMKTFCRSDFNMVEKWALMPQSTCALLILEHPGQLIFAVAASYCFALSLYCYLLLNGMTVTTICAQALWIIPQSKNICNVTFISFHGYWTKEDKTQFVKQKLIYSQWKDDSA